MNPSDRSSAGVDKQDFSRGLKRYLEYDDGFADDQTENPSKRQAMPPPEDIYHSTNTNANDAEFESTLFTLSTQDLAKSPETSRHEPTNPFKLIHRLCRHADILALIVQRLPLPDIINLYSISKAFHLVFNWNYTTMILASMRTWAPNADRIFPWRFYKDLCIKDPSHRRKPAWSNKTGTIRATSSREDLRDVPSIRWLQMVVWRWCITKDILIQLAVHSLRCPSGTHAALQRMWFLMDLPVNALRIAVVQSRTYMSQHDLVRLTAFFLKVDMLFTESNGRVFPDEQPLPDRLMFPLAWTGKHIVGCRFRELLLNERHLSSMWRAIRGWTLEAREGQLPIDRIDVFRLWIRHEYHLPATASDEAKRQSILGIPWWQVGRCSYERLHVPSDSLSNNHAQESMHDVPPPEFQFNVPGNTRTESRAFYPHQRPLIVPSPQAPVRLLRPDELVFKEGFRRRMMMHQQWARLIFFGFCDEMGRNYGDLTEEELLDWSHGHRPADDRIFVGLTPARRFRRRTRRTEDV